jgi:2-polyprenyl-3-methyl-5-hydroxy-6-metoxy-1,4-benzoquinol methylase
MSFKFNQEQITEGLGENQDYHNLAPGFQWQDAIVPKEEHHHNSYEKLAKDISSRYPQAINILELGCGAGNLAYWYRQYKPIVKYYTIDINKDVLNNGIIDPNFHNIGFTDREFTIKSANKIIKFDLILSFEHLEHIPEDRLDQFFNNIKKHSHKDTVKIMTAANFGEYTPHVLVRSREQWVEYLEKEGFKMQDISILNGNNKPFNFELHNTSELIFI